MHIKALLATENMQITVPCGAVYVIAKPDEGEELKVAGEANGDGTGVSVGSFSILSALGGEILAVRNSIVIEEDPATLSILTKLENLNDLTEQESDLFTSGAFKIKTDEARIRIISLSGNRNLNNWVEMCHIGACEDLVTDENKSILLGYVDEHGNLFAEGLRQNQKLFPKESKPAKQ